MKIKVLKAGPLTTIQDKGRFGYMSSGIGQSGVMDQDSYIKANKLLGNTNDEAVLEATIIGPDLFFEEEAIIAITGADMDVEINGKKIDICRPYYVEKGSTLKSGMVKNGARTYFAIKGGFNVPIVMGSRSTNIKCQLGGIEGRKLIDGNELVASPLSLDRTDIEKILSKEEKISVYKNEVEVRVIEGPQDCYFTEKGKRTFYNCIFTVSTDSDRMGIRLEGERIDSENGTDIVSDGISFGSIQVTPSGKPIVLMADHQTTGGYAKIATVISEDLSLLAQVKPGDKVRFKKVNIKKVQRLSLFEKMFG